MSDRIARRGERAIQDISGTRVRHLLLPLRSPKPVWCPAMKALSLLFVSSLLAGSLVLTSSSAHAESSRGAAYVQGNVLGFTALVNSGGGSGFPLEVSGGYHLGGTHEGFVIGGAQKFLFGSLGGAAFATVLRVGYDIAIPIKDFELTIAPYGFGGIAYGDGWGGDVHAHFGFGAEGRFFPLSEGAGKGFFAVARPLEVGFVPIGGGAGTAIPYTFSVGAGYAL